MFLQKLYTRVIAEKLCPHGSVSFEWSGLSCRNDMFGRQGSLDSAMDSRVSGHSSSSEGIEFSGVSFGLCSPVTESLVSGLGNEMVGEWSCLGKWG